MSLDDCAICLSEIKSTKEHSKLIVCGHRFHTKFINKYISTINKSNGIACCPLCRSGKSDIDMSKYSGQLKERFSADNMYSKFADIVLQNAPEGTVVNDMDEIEKLFAEAL